MEYLDQISPWKELKETHQTENLFLFEIKIQQNPGCPNKEYNAIFKHIHQNIKAYTKSKKTCIDQLLGNYCTLRKIRAKQGFGEQVWFVPNTVGGSRVSHNPRKCNFFLHLSLETVKNSHKLGFPLSYLQTYCA